jgi:hypothetical protein
MSKYRGKTIDDIAMWENFVDFSDNMNPEGPYLDKVRCPNPEHETQKRHFQINIDDGLVHCFARCGISGSYERAIQIVTGWEPKRVRRFILGYATRHSSPTVLHRRSRPRATEDRHAPGYARLIPPVGIEYLRSRGIGPESIAKFDIGWDDRDLRLVIPARDLSGSTRFLIKRTVSDRQPKYLYTEYPKSRLLFGACESDRSLVRSLGLILVEGCLDAIWLHQCGHHNAVATLGTGISAFQSHTVGMLRPSRIYLFFDRDSAGVRGVEIAERMVCGRYPSFVVRYPPGRSDPQECNRAEIDAALNRAIPLRVWRRIVRGKQWSGSGAK